nr:surface-adhesin E family protein [uncultured Ralstonia sp.]
MRTERTTLIYWVAAALAIGGSTAMAADNWVKLAPLADNGGSLYLDKDSIERNKDGTVRATTRDAYDAPRKLSDGKAYQYDTRTSVYDCKDGRILPVSALIQDGQHATVLTKNIDGPHWETVVPRSEGEAILRAVCQK